MKKIINSIEELEIVIDELRRSDKNIGLVSGSFDILNIGHTRWLGKCRELCDVLICLVDEDLKVKARKGTHRPIVPESERIEMVSALESVSYVMIKRLDWEKWKVIKMISPILFLTEETYGEDEIKELSKITKSIHIFPRMAKTSTSEKIRKAQMSGFTEVRDDLIEAFDKAMIKIGLQKKN